MGFAIICALLLAFLLVGVSYYVFPEESPSFTHSSEPNYGFSQSVPLSIIYINSNGSTNPKNVPIQQIGNTYKLTEDITNFTLEIDKNNIVIDGSSHTLLGFGQGSIYGSTGISLTSRSNITIKNLEIRHFWNGIEAQNSSGIIIQRNNIVDIHAAGINLNSCNNTIVTENNENNMDTAVSVSYTTLPVLPSNITVTGNTIIDTVSGVQIYSGVNSIVSKNNFVEVYYPIYASNWTSISKNNMINGIDGITIGGSFCSVSENQISNFSQSAMSLEATVNSAIFDNNIVNNKCGVVIGDPDGLKTVDNNTFYHNNFENNAQNVNIESLDYSNYWNNGTSGNYWSNYNGTYLNKEGRGNMPYIINSNNIDRYPNLSPFNNQTLQNTNQILWTFMEIGLSIPILITVGLLIFMLRQKANSRRKTCNNLK